MPKSEDVVNTVTWLLMSTQLPFTIKPHPFIKPIMTLERAIAEYFWMRYFLKHTEASDLAPQHNKAHRQIAFVL